MSMKTLHAGDGYTYLTRQVATADHNRGRGESLTDYYTAQGNPPGRWTGSGITELGVSGAVSEAQMKALFGEGLHPDAEKVVAGAVAAGMAPEQALREAKIGRRFATFDPSREEEWTATVREQRAHIGARDSVRPTELNREQSQEARHDAGLLLFAEERGRSPQDISELRRFIRMRSKPTPQPVAGFDLVFTPVKSVSVLWGLGDDKTRLIVEESHRAAIGKTIEYLEAEATFTRSGVGGVAQVDVTGLVATAFDHYDSRAGDPNLHTHLAVSNRVKGTDGKWRTLDGRMLFQAAVSASEHYNTTVEDILRERLGIEFEERESASGRQPIREIAGVNETLLVAFSARRAGIENRYNELLADYRKEYGKEAPRHIQYKFAEQANLETREAKDAPQSLAEKRDDWRTQATGLIGEDAVGTLLDDCLGRTAGVRTTMMQNTDPGQGERVPVIDKAGNVDVPVAAGRVVETVGQRRSTWRIWHVRAEADRLSRTLPNLTQEQRRDLVEAITNAAVDSHSVTRQPVPSDTVPKLLTRANGESVFRMHGHQSLTSKAILDAEDRLLMASAAPTAAPIEAASFEAALARTQATLGLTLNVGQREMVRTFACQNRLLTVGIGPAGSGKTAAMASLVAMVGERGGRVLGLAPSASAAKVLGEEINAPSETIAKILWNENAGIDNFIGAGDVLLVDEAGMASTHDLDQLVRIASRDGATVRLVGDPSQLNAVAAGGALRLLAARTDAAELSELHRFRDLIEAANTLALRDGDPAAIDFYEDADRIVGGTRGAMLDRIYADWQGDCAGGFQSVMITAQNETATELSERARLDRIVAGDVEEGGVTLRNGSRAGVGDTIVTRRNDRRLGVGTNDFVKNRDLWTVTGREADGSLTVSHQRHSAKITLPASYVAAHVELGYAFTLHQAQGMTVDKARTLIDPHMNRSGLYVGLTRGRIENTAYAITDQALDVDLDHPPERGVSGRDILTVVLAREPDDLSAHETLEIEREQLLTLASLVPQFEHAFGLYMAEDLRDVVTAAFDPILVREQTVALRREPVDPVQVAGDVAVNEAAYTFFSAHRTGSWVDAYVNRRGLGQIGAFGYAPNEWTALCDHLRDSGFTDEQMCDAGVAVHTTRGTAIDRFRNRLIVPVRDSDGRLVAFFARAAEDANEREPKYLNSPASAAYTKGDILFGLAENVDALRAGATPVIVEGPMDAYAITLGSGGRAIGLAPGGTALTEAQVAALSAVVPVAGRQVIVATDNDTAGRKAAVRAWHLLRAAGATDLVTPDLGDANDPAELLQTFGPQAVVDALASRQPLVQRAIDSYVDTWSNVLDHIDGKLGLMRQVAPLLAAIPDEERIAVTAALAHRIDLDPGVAATELVDAMNNAPADQDAPGRDQSAEQVMADAAWPALAERLAAIQAAGADPVQALADAIALRELDSAESTAQTLTWRLDRLGHPTGEDLASTPLTGCDDDTGRWLQERQAEIQARRETVTQTLGDQNPEWLSRTLGPRTEQNDQTWRSAVEAIATYRDRYDIRDRAQALGHRPDGPGTQRTAWQHAKTLIANSAPKSKDRTDPGPSHAALQRRLAEIQKRTKAKPRKKTRDDQPDRTPPQRGRDDPER